MFFLILSHEGMESRCSWCSSSDPLISKALQALMHALGCRADATHPYYGERGLNAGVMLADLARMRNNNFSADRDDIIATWGVKGALPWGDQDVLNVYLSGHRDQAYVLPCKFNVRCAELLTACTWCMGFSCV